MSDILAIACLTGFLCGGLSLLRMIGAMTALLLLATPLIVELSGSPFHVLVNATGLLCAFQFAFFLSFLFQSWVGKEETRAPSPPVRPRRQAPW